MISVKLPSNFLNASAVASIQPLRAMEKIKTSLATADLIYWKWTPNNAGECPVKVRVTYREKRKHYPVSYDGKKLFLKEADWSEIQDATKRVRGEKLKIRENVAAILVQAKAAISRATKGNRPFTWEKFEGEFLLNESDRGFLTLFADHLEGIRAEGRIGTYRTYNNALQAFKAFRKSKELSPFDITPKVLKDFEVFLEKRGCGKTTIGMYARSLKVVFNLAADENPALLENYPFARKQTDRNKYKVKTGSGHKGRPLPIVQLQKLIAIKPDPYAPVHEEARLLWLFSFHCQGMNMKDICLLKYKDIQGETIRYVRAKTKDTEAKESIMEIPVTDSIREIIRHIGNPDKRPTSYVFPIIPNGLASIVQKRVDREKTQEERIDDIIRQKTKMVNARLKTLCENNGLPVITTYWARHSYAQLLKSSGESVEMIRELLGHSDIRTTESYLKRFDLERKKEVSDKIGNLLKVS